jgi:transcriptional regulator with XRE-family HTH domain
MASDWFVSSERLARARKAQLITQEELAKRSGVSVRSIRAYERVDQRVQFETLQCLAKALATEVKEIASLRTRGESARTPEAPSPPEPPSPLPARTPLETLVDLERAAGLPVSTGPVETLTAKRLQDVFTAYALHDGARFVLEGRVDGMRGIAPDEAKLLGSRGGVAARFHVVKEVVPTKSVGVTVHSADRAHTTKLQALYGETARVVVRVVLVPGEPRDDGPGFSSFITRLTTKRPWTFVVEEVHDAATAAGDPPRANARANGRSKTAGATKTAKRG